jgi:hypothetical protein
VSSVDRFRYPTVTLHPWLVAQWPIVSGIAGYTRSDGGSQRSDGTESPRDRIDVAGACSLGIARGCSEASAKHGDKGTEVVVFARR